MAKAKESGAPVVTYGLFINQIIEFFIIAACVFVLVKIVNQIKRAPAPAPAERASVKGVRKVFANGIWHQAVIWDREALKPGDVIEGPAIIEEAFATHYIAAGWKAGLADAGAIIATRSL